MIGNLPQGMFGLRQMATTSDPRMEQPQDIAQPFTWGAGGARVSPEDIALQRRRAQAMQAAGMDFSPVQHWTQGAARVAQGLVGALQDRSLEKQQAENTAARNADIATLLGEGNADLAGALTSGDPVAAALAEAEFARRNPKPVNNDTVNDLALIEGRLGADAGTNYLQGLADPIVSVPLPGGRLYNGPRSGLQAALAGNMVPVGAPTAPVGKLTPLPDDGGPTVPQSGGF